MNQQRIEELQAEIRDRVDAYKAASAAADELAARCKNGEHAPFDARLKVANDVDAAWRHVVDARLNYVEAALVALSCYVARLEGPR